jgi:hypothetical protein
MTLGYLAGYLAAALLLAGCDSMPSLPSLPEKLWPFGGEPRREDRDRRPQGATEYRCDNSRVFYLRPLEDGAMWLIAPDREIRLPKMDDSRYGVGRILLEMRGGEATLTDPPTTFTGCKKGA